MINRVIVILALLAAPAIADAQSPAKCFADADRWTIDRKAESLTAVGQRFLEDLRKCDSTFAAAVTDAVRYELHDEEARKFARASKFVMAAYGIAWAILAAAGLALYLRQRRLNDEIASLEARLRDAEAAGK
jgi:hypothetical protein